MRKIQAPFKYNGIESILRPEYLTQARADFQDDKITKEKLATLEDKAIRKPIENWWPTAIRSYSVAWPYTCSGLGNFGNNNLCPNPGSVSIPKKNSKRAACHSFSLWQAALLRVLYDKPIENRFDDMDRRISPGRKLPEIKLRDRTTLQRKACGKAKTTAGRRNPAKGSQKYGKSLG